MLLMVEFQLMIVSDYTFADEYSTFHFPDTFHI